MRLLRAGKAGFDRHSLPGYSGRMTRSLSARLAQPCSLLRSPAGIAGLLLILAFALLYGLTLDNGLRPGELEGGDLITHQYAQVQARFSNAPGYPLYTMGGWLWFHVGRLLLGPDANPILILSSYSTLWALVALGLLYVLILDVIQGGAQPALVILSAAERGEESHHAGHVHKLRITAYDIPLSVGPGPAESGASHCRTHADALHGGPQRDRVKSIWPIAFLATAFYGVTYFFWYYAITTEQYTSSVAWTLAVVLAAFRWARTQRDRYLFGLALLTGIGLAHQITVLAVLPGVLWFVLSRQPGVLRRGRLLAGVVGLMLLPLLSYVYVYVRGAQHPEWRGVGQWASTWQWFWAFISTAQGRDELTWSLKPFVTAGFPALIWREMTWPGLAVGLLGWLTLGRRRAIMLYATLVIYLVFCWIDRLGNWYQVIMPVYALLALGLAAAAAYATNNSRILRRAQGAGVSRLIIILLLLVLIAYRVGVSYPQADASNRPDDTGLAPAWAILADGPPQGAAVLGTQAEMLALNYVTDIWGQRSDLLVLTSEQARELVTGSGFAVTEAALPLVPIEVSPAARYSAWGRTLIHVQLEPSRAMPQELMAWSHDFAGVVDVVGGRLQMNRATGEQVVFLAWRTPAPLAEDWSVSVRLLQGDAEIAQVDRQHPVFGAYPMTRWAADEVVIDAYPFMLPSDVAADGVVVILYRIADGRFVNLDVARFRLNGE